MSTELWAALGTTVAMLVLLIPGLVYAYYVLDSWIDNPQSYARVVAVVETAKKRPPSVGSSI